MPANPPHSFGYASGLPPQSDEKIYANLTDFILSAIPYLFKFVFGREERKRVTLSFLNAVLGREGDDELADITFVDRELDPHFDESIKEMKRLEKWMAYFSNKLSEQETEELAMSEAAINEAIQAEHVFMQSEVERWQYEQREKALRDYISGMRHAHRTGLAKGLAKGRAAGTQQAMLQSIRHLMEELSLSPERAMDVLHIDSAERAHYLRMLGR